MDSATIRSLDEATRELILTLSGEEWFPVYTLEKKLERPDYDPGGRRIIQDVMLRLEWVMRPGDELVWTVKPGSRRSVLEMGWF